MCQSRPFASDCRGDFQGDSGSGKVCKYSRDFPGYCSGYGRFVRAVGVSGIAAALGRFVSTMGFSRGLQCLPGKICGYYAGSPEHLADQSKIVQNRWLPEILHKSHNIHKFHVSSKLLEAVRQHLADQSKIVQNRWFPEILHKSHDIRKIHVRSKLLEAAWEHLADQSKIAQNRRFPQILHKSHNIHKFHVKSKLLETVLEASDGWGENLGKSVISGDPPHVPQQSWIYCMEQAPQAFWEHGAHTVKVAGMPNGSAPRRRVQLCSNCIPARALRAILVVCAGSPVRAVPQKLQQLPLLSFSAFFLSYSPLLAFFLTFLLSDFLAFLLSYFLTFLLSCFLAFLLSCFLAFLLNCFLPFSLSYFDG